MKTEEKTALKVLGVGAAVVGVGWLVSKAVAAPPGLARLWGMVTDADTGQPVSGIEVTLDGLATTTNGGGGYEFARVEPGIYSVMFTDPLGRYQSQIL
jgi:hypothetical protein